MEQLINKLKKRLAKDLPGIEAQYRMAPLFRERVIVTDENAERYRKSAVMILFCKDKNENWFIPLTERMAYDGVHSGQISFPGGKHELIDGDLMNTALRECYEEIGISDIEAVGQLTHLYIPVSGFLVQPFIGFCKTNEPLFKPHVREVKQILNLRLNDLLAEENIKQGEVTVQQDFKIKTPYFDLESKKIWGATAMILSELKEIMKTI